MTDTEPFSIHEEQRIPSSPNLKEAQKYIARVISPNYLAKHKIDLDLNIVETNLEAIANGLEDGRTFHEASIGLWMTAKLAPDTWEEQNEITHENRIGLSALKKISDHSETLTQRIMENKGPAYWASMLTASLFQKKVWLIDSTIRDKSKDILQNSKEAVKRVLFSGSRSAGILMKYYHSYFPEVFNSWLDELSVKLETKPKPEFVAALGVLSSPDIFMDSRKVIHKLLQGKTFNFSESQSIDIVNAWRASTKFDEIGSRVEKNLESMYEIEKLEPGSVKYLNTRFNINCFGRYPIEILVSQYQQRNDKESSYGLILYPYGDHNGAFYGDEKTFSSFFEQLQQITRSDGTKYDIRVFECKNLFSLGKSILSSFKEYGKIHFALIGGHGSTNRIWFGNSETLSTKDLIQGKGIQRVTDYFIPQPPIVLIACSAGKEGGIAEEVSKLSGGEVHGASENTGLNKLSVKLNGDSLEFTPEYREGQTATYRRGKI